MSANTQVQLPNPVRLRRLSLLRETREFYFNAEFEPIEGRRATDSNGCVYQTSDGRRCAIGRMWPEFAGRSDGVAENQENIDLAWELAQRDGIASEDKKETMEWLTQPQHFHDNVDEFSAVMPPWRRNHKEVYSRMLSALGESEASA